MYLRGSRTRGRPTRERVCLSGDGVKDGEGRGGKSGVLKKFKDGGQEVEEVNKRERADTSFNLKSLRLKTGGEGDINS